MTDATPEGTPDAGAPPQPPAAGWAPPHPQAPGSGAGVPPQVPPYAAGMHAGGSPVAQQLYPGAPPTWTGAGNTPPAAPPWPGAPASGAWSAPVPPRPAASPALSIIALILAVLGALVGFIPFAGVFLAWLLLIPAVVLAIVALVRRAPGRGMAIAALVVTAVGVVASVLWSVVLAIFGGFASWMDSGSGYDGGYDEGSSDYSYPSLGPADLADGQGTRDAPLPYGEPITLVDENTGEPVWEITVAAPVDGTPQTDEVALNGAFVTVGVRLTNLTDAAIDPSYDYAYTPSTWLLTGDGGRADTDFYIDATVFPSLWDLGEITPGQTVTYIDVFDVGPQVIDTGRYAIDFDSGETVFWGK